MCKTGALSKKARHFWNLDKVKWESLWRAREKNPGIIYFLVIVPTLLPVSFHPSCSHNSQSVPWPSWSRNHWCYWTNFPTLAMHWNLLKDFETARALVHPGDSCITGLGIMNIGKFKPSLAVLLWSQGWELLHWTKSSSERYPRECLGYCWTSDFHLKINASRPTHDIPLNAQICSSHYFPFAQGNDLDIILDISPTPSVSKYWKLCLLHSSGKWCPFVIQTVTIRFKWTLFAHLYYCDSLLMHLPTFVSPCPFKSHHTVFTWALSITKIMSFFCSEPSKVSHLSVGKSLNLIYPYVTCLQLPHVVGNLLWKEFFGQESMRTSMLSQIKKAW